MDEFDTFQLLIILMVVLNSFMALSFDYLVASSHQKFPYLCVNDFSNNDTTENITEVYVYFPDRAYYASPTPCENDFKKTILKSD